MLHVKVNMKFSVSKKMYAIWLTFLSFWPHSIILIAPWITFSWWVVDLANSWKWKVTSWQVCVAGKRHAVVPQGWLGNYSRVMKGKWNVYSTLGSPQWWACSPRSNRICIGCTLFWLLPFKKPITLSQRQVYTQHLLRIHNVLVTLDEIKQTNPSMPLFMYCCYSIRAQCLLEGLKELNNLLQ